MATAEAMVAPLAVTENVPKAAQTPSEAEMFQGKLYGCVTGAMTASLIGVGDKLGLYQALKKGKTSSADLAASCGINARFCEEWCRQQAAAGCICTNPEAMSFWLNEAQQAVLADEVGPDASPFFTAGWFTLVPGMLGAAGGPLLETFRTGLGFDFDAIGDDMLCGLGRSLGVWPRHFLVDRLAELPGMKEKLETGIKIGDVGCGVGEVLLVLARAFPNCELHGYDISAKSLGLAQERIDKEGFSNITLHNPLDEGQGLLDTSAFDLIITMDAVHDMAHPDEVLPIVRKALKDQGAYIVNDPKGLPTPAQNIAEAPDTAAMMYGISCHCCLPSGMSDKNALGLGTLGWQEPVARKMAAEAGFTRFEVIDWQNPFNNVFQLMP